LSDLIAEVTGQVSELVILIFRVHSGEPIILQHVLQEHQERNNKYEPK